MTLPKDVIEELTVRPGEQAGPSTHSTREMRTPWRDHSGESSLQHVADSELESFKEESASAQDLPYASDTYSLLVVLQALDAAGEDGTIKDVMSGVNTDRIVIEIDGLQHGVGEGPCLDALSQSSMFSTPRTSPTSRARRHRPRKRTPARPSPALPSMRRGLINTMNALRPARPTP
jgi:hypothetical protein